jgi:hypothetical protein
VRSCKTPSTPVPCCLSAVQFLPKPPPPSFAPISPYAPNGFPRDTIYYNRKMTPAVRNCIPIYQSKNFICSSDNCIHWCCERIAHFVMCQRLCCTNLLVLLIKKSKLSMSMSMAVSLLRPLAVFVSVSVF